MKIKVGLYGMNGHQVHHLLLKNQKAELMAVAGFDPNSYFPAQSINQSIKCYDNLDELLKDHDIDLISLCSPCRRNQAKDAIRCLNAGKSVYAEKPCAMEESELDRMIETSLKTGCCFHEMAGTAFEQPYLSMRQLVKEGVIGTVVQVFAQKSYPYFEKRPQDEDIDGGLICQNGVHAFRFIEHVACQRIKEVYAVETSLGNPVAGGGLQMAASCMMTLENGGVASVICNYFNQEGFELWGNEHLRIFGTNGFMESVDGGTRTRLVIKDQDYGEIKRTGLVDVDYFDMYIDSLLGNEKMPLTIDEELHPTRIAIRAKKSAISKYEFLK